MANKKYIVVTPLKVPGDKNGVYTKIPVNRIVTLPEEDGETLIALGALREPEVIDEAPANEKKPK